MKIGISLSGGGVRATVYHLGVLKYIAESGYWHSIKHLSTVSGGSLCVALIFSKNDGRWPDAETFLGVTLERCQKQLTEHSLVKAALSAGVIRPDRLLGGRAHLMGAVLRKKWGLDISLADLPQTPRWTINGTTYETGKNWRFSHKRMGDYLTGYVMNPDFPVADAVASSAGFPGGIGPLKLKTSQWNWQQYENGSNANTIEVQPLHRHYHIWDGGVYENLGSEALYKPGKGLRSDIDFYIASDAGKVMGNQFTRWQLKFPPYVPPLRLLDCAMDQIRAIRARGLFAFLNESPAPKGFYFQIGLNELEISTMLDRDVKSSHTDDEEKSRRARFAASFPTTLRKITNTEFQDLMSHGHDVASSTVRILLGDWHS